MNLFSCWWRMHAPWFALVLSVTLPASGVAYATDPSLSLQDAVRKADQTTPLLEVQADHVQVAQQDAIRAGRLPDPDLQIGMENLNAAGPEAFVPAANMMTMQTIGITQRLPSGAARAAERAMANAGIETARAQLTATMLQVHQSAAIAWVGLWAAEQQRELLDALQGEAATAVRVSQARLAGGRGDADDALAARAEQADLANRILAAQAQVIAARAQLARWIGSSAQRALAPPPDFGQLPQPPAVLLAQLDRQATLLEWSAREASAEAALAAARATKHPNWSVGVSYGRRFGGLDDVISVNVGVSLPIFSGDRQDPDISARDAERNAVIAKGDDLRREERATVQRTLAEWRGLTEQVQNYRSELLPLAEDRSQVALAAYRGGALLQPWLEARRAEIRTRIEYAKALAAWGSDWAALAYLIPQGVTP